MNPTTCLLCHARGAEHRPGRLGRYAQTCDQCEARRGHHAHVDARHDVVAAGAPGALQWSARPR